MSERESQDSMPNLLPMSWFSALPAAQVGRERAVRSAQLRLRRGGSGFLVFVRALLLAALLVHGPTAHAVLIATGDGTGNTTAPASDPGFDHVGVVNGLSGVYFRNGWVLTAGHVGEGDLTLGGVVYPVVPGSFVRFENADSTLADLAAFKLRIRPPLPDLVLADAPPTQNALITVIGNGLGRGTAQTWMGIDGWSWTGQTAIRWGTNRISQADEYQLFTRAFRIVFDDYPSQPPGQHEADIVVGDSGGGAFTGSGASARLIGILYAHATFLNQPANTSFFGNAGLIANLYAYRADILAVTGQSDCADGLDDDGDGLVDHPLDPGCASLLDPSERGASFQCDNGIDDDGDLAIDFPADSGCLHPTNPIEAPEPAATTGLVVGALALTRLARRGSRPPQRIAQTSSTRSTR